MTWPAASKVGLRLCLDEREADWHLYADLLDPQPAQEPVARLGYHPLSPSELDALVALQSEPALDDSSGSDNDDESEALTPGAFSPAPVYIKDEDTDAFDVDSFLAAPTTLWADPSKIPKHVYDFLPPFPNHERETDVPEPMRRRREREREHEVAAAWAGANDGSDSQDPWIASVLYEKSHLNEAHPASALPPRSPPPGPTSRRRRRSLSPAPRSSIDDFDEAARLIGGDAAVFQRINPKRRQAAASISGSNDFALFGDSLFGNVPVPVIRHAGVTAGFLPYGAPPLLHPLTTSLPHTIATAVPKHPAPHAPLLAPSIHPRIPTIMGSVAAHLAQPSAPHLALFSRLTRIGPPGPLDPNGNTSHYEYIGNTSIVEMSVEWPQRAYNHRLPARPRGDAPGDADGPSSSGIRLKIGRSGSVPGTAAGSPAATPGGSWTGYGSPAPHFDRGASYAESPMGTLDPVAEEAPVASSSGISMFDAAYQPFTSLEDAAAALTAEAFLGEQPGPLTAEAFQEQLLAIDENAPPQPLYYDPNLAFDPSAMPAFDASTPGFASFLEGVNAEPLDAALLQAYNDQPVPLEWATSKDAEADRAEAERLETERREAEEYALLAAEC